MQSFFLIPSPLEASSWNNPLLCYRLITSYSWEFIDVFICSHQRSLQIICTNSIRRRSNCNIKNKIHANTLFHQNKNKPAVADSNFVPDGATWRTRRNVFDSAPLLLCVETWRHPQNRKYVTSSGFALSSEQDRATTTVNMYRKLLYTLDTRFLPCTPS